MALSASFDKSAVSAAELLRGFDYAQFRDELSNVRVAIAFDEEAASAFEGRTTLELLVNLTARLYGDVAIEMINGTGPGVSSFARRLAGLATEINPAIATTIVDLQGTASGASDREARVVVGATPVVHRAPVVFVGSDRWEFATSTVAPVGSGASSNPFGAAAAACIGAACLFRMIFARQLAHQSEEVETDARNDTTACSVVQLEDPPMRVSLLSMSHVQVGGWQSPSLDGQPVNIDETCLVGVGAIGNASAWVLGKTPGVTGLLHLIDHEQVDESNLQRYVLTSAADVGLRKVDLFSKHSARTEAPPSQALTIRTHAKTWAEFISTRGSYVIPRALLALDSAEDRIAVQGSLPQWVANAWTQPANAGVSRHPRFDANPCIVCLYMPDGRTKGKDQLYAEAVGAQGPVELMQIRELLHSGRSVGAEFLQRTAQRLGVPVEPLAAFAARPLADFYHDALCGGIVLRLSNGKTATRVEAPLAFQSAFAGVLLAAELVLDALGARPSHFPTRTEVDLLHAVAPSLNVPAAKSATGRCICEDAAFVRAYLGKYGSGTRVHGVAGE